MYRLRERFKEFEHNIVYIYFSVMTEWSVTMDNKKKIVNRISIISIVVNTVLSGLKFFAGIFASSSAMISDSVHSMSDVLSTIAVMAGVSLSEKHSDKGHPYGHERLESIFSMILAGMLFATGIGIGYAGIKGIIFKSYTTPGMFALIAAAISIVVKELMYRYTVIAAKKVKSTVLKADAWHHRSDALSSVGALIGIGGSMLGYPICDPIASIVICLFIVKAAWDIFLEASNQLVDHACSEEEENKIRGIIEEQEGVLCIDLVRTRMFGSRLYVDVEIGADGELSLYEAHDIAERVHDKLEKDIPDIKHCMVHVNPKNIEKNSEDNS